MKKEILFKNEFWRGLYPNSLVETSEENVYMGMRSGYVKFNIKSKTYAFYKYKKL